MDVVREVVRSTPTKRHSADAHVLVIVNSQYPAPHFRSSSVLSISSLAHCKNCEAKELSLQTGFGPTSSRPTWGMSATAYDTLSDGSHLEQTLVCSYLSLYARFLPLSYTLLHNSYILHTSLRIFQILCITCT